MNLKVQDFGQLGCDVVLVSYWFPVFRKNIVPSKYHVTPNDTASHPRRPESSTELLWNPHIVNNLRVPQRWEIFPTSYTTVNFFMTSYLIILEETRLGH
jgi:hypothetical protein